MEYDDIDRFLTSWSVVKHTKEVIAYLEEKLFVVLWCNCSFLIKMKVNTESH